MKLLLQFVIDCTYEGILLLGSVRKNTGVFMLGFVFSTFVRGVSPCMYQISLEDSSLGDKELGMIQKENNYEPFWFKMCSDGACYGGIGSGLYAYGQG